MIRELDLAYSFSKGQLSEPGPSYIEIPTDILRCTVKKKLILNDLMKQKKPSQIYPNPKKIDEFINKLNNAKRPLLISGRGARNSGIALENFLTKTGVFI